MAINVEEIVEINPVEFKETLHKISFSEDAWKDNQLDEDIDTTSGCASENWRKQSVRADECVARFDRIRREY